MGSDGVQVPHLRAISMAARLRSLVDSPWSAEMRGEVASVHRRAMNLQIGRALVTVAQVETGGLPDGILVAGGLAPRDADVRGGDRVDISARRLRAGRLEIDLRGARPWSARLPVRALPTDVADRRASLAAAIERHAGGRLADGARGRSSRSLDALARETIGPRTANLRNALLDREDLEAAASAGRALIGAGIGLTPTGDDILVGLTAGLVGVGDGRALTLAIAWAASAEGRTTEVAVAYHRAAARGEYAERLHWILAAVLDGTADEIVRAVDRAAAWGATSGIDTLLGLAVGLEAGGPAGSPIARGGR